MATHNEENPDFDIRFDFDGLDQLDENALAEIDEIENKENGIKQPAEKKTRFTELEETALDEIVASAPSKKTNYTTKWGVSVFRGECIIVLMFV